MDLRGLIFLIHILYIFLYFCVFLIDRKRKRKNRNIGYMNRQFNTYLILLLISPPSDYNILVKSHNIFTHTRMAHILCGATFVLNIKCIHVGYLKISAILFVEDCRRYFRTKLTFTFAWISDSKSSGDPKFMEAFGKNDVLLSVIKYILISFGYAKMKK